MRRVGEESENNEGGGEGDTMKKSQARSRPDIVAMGKGTSLPSNDSHPGWDALFFLASRTLWSKGDACGGR